MVQNNAFFIVIQIFFQENKQRIKLPHSNRTELMKASKGKEVFLFSPKAKRSKSPEKAGTDRRIARSSLKSGYHTVKYLSKME